MQYIRGIVTVCFIVVLIIKVLRTPLALVHTFSELDATMGETEYWTEALGACASD